MQAEHVGDECERDAERREGDGVGVGLGVGECWRSTQIRHMKLTPHEQALSSRRGWWGRLAEQILSLEGVWEGGGGGGGG